MTSDLIGRVDDLARLSAFVDRARHGGGALLLSGEPGVGKSALLAAATAHAQAARTRILRADGAQFESTQSFAAVHQVLHPLLGTIESLGLAQQRVLDLALGLRRGSPPSLLVIADAALALLAQAAEAGPVLVVVDDLPWLDRASALVLAIVARRLQHLPIGFVAAYRSGAEGFFDRAGLPEHEVRPLDADAATTLVGREFPALAPAVRRRLVDEAQGNPLALLELPVALTTRERSGADHLPDVLPLTRRLQTVFESRVEGLPARTRQLLLAAVLDGTGVLRVVAADGAGLADLAPAERAGLIQVDERAGRVTFRHPLTRSAVMDLSTAQDRVRAHAALAEHLTDSPERRAWHLAHATVGPDEHVAALLEDAAHAFRSRGDAAGSVSALLRAADLSPAGADRSRRLAEAAYLGAVVTGDLRDVPRLLADARRGEDGRARSLGSAVAAAHHLLLSGEGDVDTAHRLLVGAIEMQPAPYDSGDATLVEAFYTLAWVCYFGGRADLWVPYHRCYAQLTEPIPELLALVTGTFADPARTAPALLGRIDAAIAALDHGTDQIWSIRVGLAAMFVDRLSACRTALSHVLHDEQGGATVTLHARSLLGLDQLMTGEWDAAQVLAEEHIELSRSLNYQLLECLGLYVRAMVAALRGDRDTARALTDRMTMWATPRSAGLVLRIATQVRMMDALGRGEFEAALRHATAITPVGELAADVPHALWVIMDVVEAAVRTGRATEAAAHVAAARASGAADISPRLAMTIEAAAAMAAPDREAAELFDRALAVSGGERWPFDQARIALAYGERLRRARATAEARDQLSRALDTFRRLDARPWMDRAAKELRATGHAAGDRVPARLAALTPQQREIAELAAGGLSNKQIGERLFLSPRTVGTHLYQLFPKLGITSRAALRDALAQTDDGPVI
ncbi:LuxR family transcriptional regulator [Asanoa ferruginea]|uniref:helix-turn-helix transcriptional regulator n=1 Tax=Asanoa ferruginea TaxID=53367 RepID=UPI001945A068|nr:LuxR family transcriptional regulator [Asanoa ferruginea]GIF51377.1 LuxR family transcriptional regulator [Asanoa ferruginea]